MVSAAFRNLVPIATRTLSRTTSANNGNHAKIITKASTYRFLSDVVPGVGKGKTSTGLVGLAVDHDSIPKIIEKYQALLDKAKSMPETAQYRINIEKICRHRINAATSFPDDPEKVEDLCNCGQVEELVVQADNEMLVMNMYLRNRWWELVKEADIQYEPSQTEGGDHGDVEWDSKTEKKNEAYNADKVQIVHDLQSINQDILVKIGKLSDHAYIINTSIVATYRLYVIQDALAQLKKNPDKAGKVEKKLIREINFGSTLDELVMQAKDELKKIEDRLGQR